MSIRLEFEIQFKSDFHVGAGHGLGLQVDSALLRDADNVPVIRGTVLTGLLRESLMNLVNLERFRNKHQHRRVAEQHSIPEYCGQFSPDETDNCPLCAIFGSPRIPKRWRISSARPMGLEVPQHPKNEWKAGQTAAQRTFRVRVNPRTRRAEENKLFTREEGDGKVRYRFVAECLTDDEESWQEAEWLLAAARLMRHFGASKRRGRGECEIHLVDDALEKKLLNNFDAHHLGGKSPYISLASKNRTPTHSLRLPEQPEKHTYRLRVLLRADEPLLIGKRAESGNQFETLESIPGSMWRGALAWRVARRFGKQMDNHDSNEYATFVNLFYQDAIRFSPLLPVQPNESGEQGYPSIPTPLDLLTCDLHPGYEQPSQDKGHGTWNTVWNEAPMPDNCPVCEEADEALGTQGTKVKLKQVRAFLPLNEFGLTVNFRPKQTSEMHIRIQPRTGRVRTGDLFSYVALQAGQYFVGEITCSDKTVWDRLCQLAEVEADKINIVHLGKANRRGYGKASWFCWEADKSPWHGAAIEQRVTNPSKVALTLLSDAIVMDPWGRFMRGFDDSWLQRELELPEGATVTVDKARCFSGVRAVDSFNATFGLPRARDQAIVAGSTVRLSFCGIEPEELQARLAIIEAEGIGLRCDEGFGRVVFNHSIYQELEGWAEQEAALTLEPLKLGGDASGHKLTRLYKFIEAWESELANLSWDEWKNLSKHTEHFEAVARLLHTTTVIGADALRESLKELGQPSQILPEKILNEVKDGRDKKNFFQEKGKEGMRRLIGWPKEESDEVESSSQEKQEPLSDEEGDAETPQESLLEKLERLVDEQRDSDDVRHYFWQVGLQMLAARISIATKTQQGES